MLVREVLAELQREVLDVQVRVRFQRRVYRGTRSWTTRPFRLVAVRNAEAGRYHCYLTNVPATSVDAETIGATYSLRWQAELLFKCLKSNGHFDQIPSHTRRVVDCLLWSSLLALAASQALYWAVRDAVDRSRTIPILRWSALFSREAAELLLAVVDGSHRDIGLERRLLHEAPDRNRARPDRSIRPELLREWC